MAGLCEGGNEPSGSLKASKLMSVDLLACKRTPAGQNSGTSGDADITSAVASAWMQDDNSGEQLWWRVTTGVRGQVGALTQIGQNKALTDIGPLLNKLSGYVTLVLGSTYTVFASSDTSLLQPHREWGDDPGAPDNGLLSGTRPAIVRHTRQTRPRTVKKQLPALPCIFTTAAGRLIFPHVCPQLHNSHTRLSP
ncbi:hypothetical protein ANN_05828 [Periplaneta americana]|uniref:Uncharacterized protein n=1 Tax=Periplaneta americana TaxID=6978 RepID=A0ABQ8TC04_PERAM|nr:hypothetical protein ANN_05828 [Periplaneta americana]